MHKLSAQAVARSKVGKIGDGAGLWLVTTTGRGGSLNRKWTFRFSWGETVEGKQRQREMGLGSYPDISLAEARDKAADARKLLRENIDPIESKKQVTRGVPTFAEVAGEVVAIKKRDLRNSTSSEQWRMTLFGEAPNSGRHKNRKPPPDYCAPIRNMPVTDIDTAAVLSVLKPYLNTVPETMSRLRGRIERVLDHAKAHGHIPTDAPNPARWHGHLELLLGARRKLVRGHHTALPYRDLPGFIGRLRERQAVAALALEFLVLTACRSREVLGARWDEIDLDARVWTIPASRMKAFQEHCVPLSDAAMAILAEMNEVRISEFVFPGHRRNQPLSSSAMDLLLRRRLRVSATVHGFRSSFRDWAGEQGVEFEVAEQCLAHTIGSAVTRAYLRTTMVERRRPVMQAWANFLDGKETDNVLRFERRA